MWSPHPTTRGLKNVLCSFFIVLYLHPSLLFILFFLSSSFFFLFILHSSSIFLLLPSFFLLYPYLPFSFFLFPYSSSIFFYLSMGNAQRVLRRPEIMSWLGIRPEFVACKNMCLKLYTNSLPLFFSLLWEQVDDG